MSILCYIIVSKFESSKIFEMAERVLKTNGKHALFQKVQELCIKVHNLLKEANQQNNKDVVEACFQCWYDMHEFGGKTALVTCRILGT